MSDERIIVYNAKEGSIYACIPDDLHSDSTNIPFVKVHLDGRISGMNRTPDQIETIRDVHITLPMMRRALLESGMVLLIPGWS